MPVRHRLSYGECLQVLASNHGFRDGKDIFDLAVNADLRSKRSSPPDVAPGDLVEIPEPRPKTLSAATDARHVFRVQVPKAILRIEVHDDADEPIASKPFDLHLGDDKIEGTTTGDGLVVQSVPLPVVDGKLIVYASSDKAEGRWCWQLRIANLEAPESTQGSWQRLSNLGYWSTTEPPQDGDEGVEGPADDDSRDPLVLALRAFQHDEGLDETGSFDDATRKKLVERHGI